MRKRLMTAVVSFLVLAGGAAQAERPWPETVFDCQVLTGSGAAGLVTLQTFSAERAVEEAKGKPALTRSGGDETAVSVIQCIERFSDQRFSDLGFQGFYENRGVE